MQSPTALPGFWIFMYRASPLTYWVGGIAGTMLHGRQVECSAKESSVFNPPDGQTCQQYLATYLIDAPGTLQNPDARSQCRYCALSNADQFLAGSGISYGDRWRNFGLMWVYIGFNIFGAVALYYFFRVRGTKKSKPSSGGAKKAGGFAKGLFNRQPPAAKQAAGDQTIKTGEPGAEAGKANPSAF